MELFTTERRAHIAALVLAQQRVTVAALRARFGVSEVTLRKDLDWLEDHGQLVRTHGGAIAPQREIAESAFAVRERQQHAEKHRIGQAAAALVHDGDTIALDASTTALALARCLTERQELTVVTSGLRVAQELATATGVMVLMPGGMVRAEAFSLVGGWGTSLLEQVHIHKAFVGAQGLTITEGLTDVNADEIAMKRALVNAAREVVAIVDHTKWEHVALATFCDFTALTHIITDEPTPSTLRFRVAPS